MGKIYLNSENKLVVETDNGVINPDGTKDVKVESTETYTVDVNSIAKLLSIVNNQSSKVNTIFLGYEWRSQVFLVSNDDIVAEIKERDCAIHDLELEKQSLCEKTGELKNIISNYNQNKKIFWKPIKIED